MKKRYINRNKGFTLVEVLAVFAILAILSAISYPIILRQAEKGRETEARSMMKDLETALTMFKDDNNGMYPFRDSSTPNGEEVYKTSNFKWLWNTLEGTNGIATKTNHNNLREKEYIKFKLAVDGKSGVTRNGSDEVTSLRDPWGRIYYVCIDHNVDGEVDLSLIPDTALSDEFPYKSEPFKGEVGVICQGKKDVWEEGVTLTTWR